MEHYYRNISKYLMVVAGFVGRAPNVGEGRGWVEPVEDAERQRDVAQDGPKRRPIELLQTILNEKVPMYTLILGHSWNQEEV